MSEDSSIAEQPETIRQCKHESLQWHKVEKPIAGGLIRTTWVFECQDCSLTYTESADYMSDDYYQVIE